jgi:diguanylate cyclase (GGDEF)-like protein/PAS domain S-box-containing protein
MSQPALSPAGKPKILIVDDDPRNLIALEHLLLKVDAEVVSANSGNKALALTLDHDFVLILLDVHMPDIDGYEVATLLQGEARSSGVPIIFLTAAYTDDRHKLKGYATGAVDYLEKPIDEVVLLSKVRVFLELRKKQELYALMKSLEQANRRLEDEIERRRMSEAASQQLADTVFAGAGEGIMVTDAENRVVAVNPAFTTMTGYSPAEMVGQPCRLVDCERHNEVSCEAIRMQVQKSDHWHGEIWCRKKSGEAFLAWFSISAIRQSGGAVVKYVAIVTDITRRKDDEFKLWQQANFDALTGLPNRALFMEHLSTAVADTRREGDNVALMFIDIDRFKLINDSLGHGVGDLLLQEVAIRLKACLRENDTVSRLSGDEFTVILKGVREAANAVPVARQIIDAMARPFQINGNEVSVGASIGISLFPQDADSAGSLLRNADMAMYSAKEAGRNTFAFFAREMNEKIQSIVRLSNDLRHAIARNELRVHYQPIVNADTLQIVAAEALVRWQHPQLGMVSPADFIPIAEDTGLIGPMTDWIVQVACRDATSWQQAGCPLRVSVNISNRHRHLDACIELAGATLEQFGLPRDVMTLEITESFALEDAARLHAIRESGIGLAIDDFGTGYSSLSYLRRLPADTLKIDRSFISELGEDADATMLVGSIIAIAHGLRMRVVAEGVETREQLAYLQAAGCDLLQGYFFSRPLPNEAFMECLKTYAPPLSNLKVEAMAES